jgi:hypothetical protein
MDVVISGSRSSSNDWHASNLVPVSELTPLTPEQKEVVRKLGISEEGYARSVFAEHLTRVELEQRARRLGALIERWCEARIPKVSVTQVWLKTFEGRFRVELASEGHVELVFLEEEVVDDLFDSGSERAEHQLRRAVELAFTSSTAGATA